MLNSFRIEGFKCFKKLDLELKPLTLLSGVNGGGKSSVIQALVLLARTLPERQFPGPLRLDYPDLALGSVADVLNQRSRRRKLVLGASTDSESVEWHYKAEDRHALALELDMTKAEGDTERASVENALLNLSWVSAERVGPRELLPLYDARSHRHVGARGELAAGLLHWRDDDPVRQNLCLHDYPPTLFHQVRGRMQEFFPGSDVRVSQVDGVSFVSLRLRSSAGSDFQRPQNVGFGLTQLFPVLVALLAAEQDSVLLIENPEVHLHPQAQQRVGVLLARVAASGVQVIVETHSDHVLNGLRLAAKRKVIRPTDVAVHFFAPGDSSFQPLSPKLDSDGRLDSWPEGFFDQFDRDLSELL